jgi:uncharacterized protein (DUF58 family)
VIKHAWLLGLLVSGLLMAALLFRQGELLALAFPAFVYLGAAVIFNPGKPDLKAELVITGERISYGKQADVSVAVQNVGPSLQEAALQVKLESEHEEAGQEVRLLHFQAGAVEEWKTDYQFERGEYRIAGVRALTGDHFGLFQEETLIPVQSRLFFYPQIWKLQRIPIRPLELRGFAGYIPARRPGSGVDFFGLREYHPGDPPGRINWRISTRPNKPLYTNEFEQERVADVGLILDTRQNVYPTGLSGGETVLFEAAVRVSAALAISFLEDGNRLALLMYGFNVERLFPGYGKRQVDRVLRALSRARLGFNTSLTHLAYLPTRMFPPRSQLVIVSPLHPYDVPTYRRLRSQGYEVIVVSPNPLDTEYDSGHSSETWAYAFRLARIERKILLRSLRKIGVQVVDWPLEANLDQTIQQQLGMLTHRRRLRAL